MTSKYICGECGGGIHVYWLGEMAQSLYISTVGNVEDEDTGDVIRIIMGNQAIQCKIDSSHRTGWDLKYNNSTYFLVSASNIEIENDK